MLCIFITTGGDSSINKCLGMGSACQLRRNIQIAANCFQSGAFHCEQWFVCVFLSVTSLKGGEPAIYWVKMTKKGYTMETHYFLSSLRSKSLHLLHVSRAGMQNLPVPSVAYVHPLLPYTFPCSLTVVPFSQGKSGHFRDPPPPSPFQCAKTVRSCCGRHTGCSPPSPHTANLLSTSK